MDKFSSMKFWMTTILAIITTICIVLFFVGGTFAGFFGLFLGFIPGVAIWGFLILLGLGLIVVFILYFNVGRRR